MSYRKSLYSYSLPRLNHLSVRLSDCLPFVIRDNRPALLSFENIINLSVSVQQQSRFRRDVSVDYPRSPTQPPES